MKHTILTIANTFVVWLILIFCTGCEKYLSAKPDNSLTVPVTLNEIEGLFNDADKMNFGLTPSYGEASADDYFLLPATFNALATQFQDVYFWNLKEYKYQNDWGINYFPVYNSNYALESINKINVTSTNVEQWNRIKGFALFTRAHSFLSLSEVFAKAFDSTQARTDKGIVLRLGSDFNQPSQRASVWESYDQIITDAKAAAVLLPNVSSNLLLPSKAASYGLLARTYLFMRVYDSAFKYSNLCLSLKSDLLDYNTLNLGSSTPFPRFDNPEVIYYTEMNKTNGNPFPNRGLIDTALTALYKENDLRKIGYLSSQANGYKRFKGAYTENSSNLFSGIATDEIILIRAECYARNGLLSQAMDDLNSLLIKRWNSSTPFIGESATDKSEAINKIILERRKELLMRGLRWPDIKRLNKEGRGIILNRVVNGTTFTLVPNDNRYALTIPSDIINITGISQNEF